MPRVGGELDAGVVARCVAGGSVANAAEVALEDAPRRAGEEQRPQRAGQVAQGAIGAEHAILGSEGDIQTLKGTLGMRRGLIELVAEAGQSLGPRDGAEL